ncbi:MAG: PAS domain S-box protein [Desulfobulbus sp.]|jgi:PAS domain S-box-containing protein|uniref:PAS domain S-box protein n=1 Tax=Desulfobulbus sp. TaxID=895 RepID=UPI00284C84CD|nr:PAS domain S-box protein [Desulfobulbus sp.]MDR2550532.1 PAS domain S-box protein [Desulfobulbus sp.]
MPPLSTANRIAAKAALIYLAVSVLWIGFSDRAAYVLINDGSTFFQVQTAKGWLFVAITALLLFFASRRELDRYERERDILRKNEQFLANVFQAAPAGMGVARNRIISTANKRLCAMTGYRPEELIGANARILYANNAEYKAAAIETYRQIGQSGNATIETRWQRRDGSGLDVLLSSTPIDAGTPDAVLAFTAIDITASKRARMAVQASEERYRGLIELAVDGIVLGNGEGIITEINGSMCAMLGEECDTIVGKHISELAFTPKSMEKVPFRFDLLRRGQTVVSERDLLRPDGSTIIFEMRSKIMPDGSYQAIFRDITERKRTEQELRESREKFALAFDQSPDAVNINRLADGMYVDINRGFTDLTGFTREDVAGMTSLALNLWHDPADRQLMVTAMRTRGSCDNFEAVFRCKDGTLGTGLLSARPLVLNGEPHIISITRDIRQRKQTEADLKRLKVAIEQAGEIIVITDADGSIQYANPAFTRVTGYTVDEVIQRNSRILKSGEHNEDFYRDLWQTITSGRTWSGRLVNRKKDGSLYTEEASISPVFDRQGLIVNFVAIKHDITTQLKLEAQYRQAQKMESIGRLTGGVAHDFNNILAVIIGYAEMALEKTDPDKPLHADLKKIHEAALRSADIVRQLLAYSRKQHIVPQTTDLNQTVNGILSMLRRLIGEDIELLWLPGSGLPAIKMDPAQIDQILANLCVNARDAIEENGTITIRTGRIFLDEAFCDEHHGAEPGDYIVLSVADDGCGIEPELLDNIYEPFFTTKDLFGTGLGLATVYGIVQQNAGIIEVESTPGQGTVFFIYLPVAVAGAIQDTQGRSRPAIALGQGETVLLVEDDPSLLALGQSMLKKLGYNALTAQSPEKAMSLVGQYPGRIDLLITDVIMPGMNGKELADRLAAVFPTLRIIYMSGYTADIIAQHGVLDQQCHFLPKPFSTMKLAEKIRAALNA